MFGAVGDLQRQQRVGVAGGQRDVMAGQLQVDGVVAVLVQDGGDLAPGTDTAGGALAELLAPFDGQLLGHAMLPVVVTRSTGSDATATGGRASPSRPAAITEQAKAAPSPHGP